MTTRAIAAAIVAVAAVLSVLAPQEAMAQDTAVRVLASNGVKAAMQELRPECERAIGHPLTLEFNSTASLKDRINAGEGFDVAILASEAISALIKEGKIAGDSHRALGHSTLGIGIRAGAAKPDIRTPAALKQTLLGTKSITYPRDGASRAYIEKMFERLGIAAEVQPRIILAPGSGPATESVAAGQAELVITLFSEILPVQGVDILGPLPSDFSYSIRFGAGISATAKHADAAGALITFLTGPKAAPTLKAKGLEPR